MLCGLDFMGEGTYTSEGITKLCEALKGSAVTSSAVTTHQATTSCYLGEVTALCTLRLWLDVLHAGCK
jgi:hypothetical protein